MQTVCFVFRHVLFRKELIPEIWIASENHFQTEFPVSFAERVRSGTDGMQSETTAKRFQTFVRNDARLKHCQHP
jgi:hypothetical protein